MLVQPLEDKSATTKHAKTMPYTMFKIAWKRMASKACDFPKFVKQI